MPPVASKQKHFGFGYSHTKEAEFLARFFARIVLMEFYSVLTLKKVEREPYLLSREGESLYTL